MNCKIPQHSSAVAVVTTFIAILATALFSTSVAAQPSSATLKPGEYISEHSQGQLVLKPAKGGALSFLIESVGANGHTCSLEGELRGGRATLEGIEAKVPCVVTMTNTPAGIEVKGSESGSCQFYCGVRATFEATYFQPAPACREKAVTTTRNTFKRHYDAKKFAEARAVLEPLLKDCTRSLYWLDEGRIRNDLAVTLHKLGDLAGCRDVLKPLSEDARAADTTLQESYPPTDLESVMPIVRATRTNLKLCTGK
ncbi:MAG: hypothetical protein ABI583_05400 [Betaproteobacteria bacterium]